MAWPGQSGGEPRRLRRRTTRPVFRVLFQIGALTPSEAESPTGLIGGKGQLTRNRRKRKRYQEQKVGSQGSPHSGPACWAEEEANSFLVFRAKTVVRESDKYFRFRESPKEGAEETGSLQ